MNLLPPDKIFKELFTAQHLSGLWPDGKTIADMTPLFAPDLILEKYRADKDTPGFDLKTFTSKHFDIPTDKTSHFKSDPTMPLADHINLLWSELKREADTEIPGSSLIPLPYPYIVPGGRFNEIYYWDSYFTMLGLRESGQVETIERMVKNFAHLLERFGYIPNGNRTYFLGRSQPPFFSLMVQLLAEIKGEEVYRDYRVHLITEYLFWQMLPSATKLNEKHQINRVVLLDKHWQLNHYYDANQTPRAEMFATDLECAEVSGREQKSLFRHLRAACESGWDFSSRWLRDPNDLSTIHTTDFIPVDLNCLIFHLQTTLAKALKLEEKTNDAEIVANSATQRKTAVLKYLWSARHDFFMDYDFVEKRNSDVMTLAGMYPLFFEIATPEQAESCAQIIEKHFLRPGGVVTTPIRSGQQWDAPNGWAPLQWITIKGLRNYGFDDLANEIKNRWVSLNTQVFRNTGKLLEKYNVEDTDLPTGGGEYPVQDGFGWTNGVLLALLNES